MIKIISSERLKELLKKEQEYDDLVIENKGLVTRNKELYQWFWKCADFYYKHIDSTIGWSEEQSDLFFEKLEERYEKLLTMNLIENVDRINVELKKENKELKKRVKELEKEEEMIIPLVRDFVWNNKHIFDKLYDRLVGNGRSNRAKRKRV